MCHYTEVSFELFIEYLCRKAKTLINKCFNEELSELIAQEMFKIEPKNVRERIDNTKHEILEDLYTNEKEPFLIVLDLFIREYFPKKLKHAKKVLEGVKERSKEAKIKRDLLNQKILEYIVNFLEKQSIRIYQMCIRKNQKKLVEYKVEELLNKAFYKQVKEVNLSIKHIYKEHFIIELSRKIMQFIQKIEKKLHNYYESQKSLPKSYFRRFFKQNKLDLTLIVFFLPLTAFLVIFCYWYFNLPLLERFSFFNEHIWTAPLFILLGTIDFGLLIRLFKSILIFGWKKFKNLNKSKV